MRHACCTHFAARAADTPNICPAELLTSTSCGSIVLLIGEWQGVDSLGSGGTQVGSLGSILGHSSRAVRSAKAAPGLPRSKG